MQAIPTTHLLSIAAAIAAVAGLVFALRGRRVDEHPLCRRCGFDLFGKPAETTVCGECGADLNRRRAVRIGHRERRRNIIRLVVPILLASLAWEGWTGWKAARATDWYQHVPVWLLVHQAHAKSPGPRDAALAELARRISVGTLPTERAETLVDEAFARQADPNQPWIAGWGDIIETARAARKIDNERWGLYLFQGFQVSLVPARPVLRSCDPLEFTLHRGPDRFGNLKAAPEWFNVGIYSPASYNEEQVLVFGRDEKQRWIEGKSNDSYTTPPARSLSPLCDDASIVPGGGVGSTLPITIKTRWPADKPLSTGRQTVRATFMLAPTWSGTSWIWPVFFGSQAIPAPPKWRRAAVACTFDVADPPRVTTSASLAPAIDHALSVESMEFFKGTQDTGEVWELLGRVRCGDVPVDLSCRAIFHVPGSDEQFPGDEVFVPKGSDTATVVVKTKHYYVPDDYPGRTVDIELVPESSASPAGTKEVWGKPIWFKNIAIKDREYWLPDKAWRKDRPPKPVAAD